MAHVENRVAGPVTVDREGEERVWRAGKLPPMKIRKLPEAPAAAHMLGPAMILVALGVGFGETYLWPRLVIVFGPDIRWLFTVGVLVQTVVMLEMARYAMATGESIFFGAARICAAAHVDVLPDRRPGLHLARAHLRRRGGARGDHRHLVAGVRDGRPAHHRGHVHGRQVHLQLHRGAAGVRGRRPRDRLRDRGSDRGEHARPRRDPGGHRPLRHVDPVRGLHGGVLPGRRRRAGLRRPVRHAADVVHAVAA